MMADQSGGTEPAALASGKEASQQPSSSAKNSESVNRQLINRVIDVEK